MNLKNKTFDQLFDIWGGLLEDLQEFYRDSEGDKDFYHYEDGKWCAISCLVQSSGLYDDKIKTFIKHTIEDLQEFKSEYIDN